MSIEQSSLFSHAIGIAGTIIGGGGFSFIGGSVGLSGGYSATGEGSGLVGSLIGIATSSSGNSALSPIGTTVTGLSDNTAIHCMVGLPVVPGGHTHDGLCPTV